MCSPCSPQGGDYCIQVFFFRGGQNWGNRPDFPRAAAETTNSEVLESFIGQFYDERPAPPLVLLSEAVAEHDLLQDALSLRMEKKVELARN